ncbi:hypothetical protein MTR67_019761 [Solanum verrucosum]|uniref:Uncharacterized protein n=1 Tax=Solanum verrucosum TaxID=315347 RepID=A0AAF0TNJ4_SOLVR|nr:hypothetical protein MTR67_019761 [Solanum verrucosum]
MTTTENSRSSSSALENNQTGKLNAGAAKERPNLDHGIMTVGSSVTYFTETVQQHSGSTFMDLFSRKYTRLLIIGIGLMALVQLGGNNAITSFATSIFRAADHFTRLFGRLSISSHGCSLGSQLLLLQFNKRLLENTQTIVLHFIFHLQSRVLSLQKKLDNDFLCCILLCQTSSKPSSIQRSDAIMPKITAIPLPATCTMDISPSHSDILLSMDESMDTMRSQFNIYSFLFILWIWRNLDKIDNIQQLRKLEDSISKSLNEIAKHKSSCDILVLTDSKRDFEKDEVQGNVTFWPGSSIGKGQEKKGDIELKFFEFHDLKVVTDIFSPNNKLGERGFGTVFKVLFLQPGYLQGQLLNGQQIVVKRLSTQRQGLCELKTEAGCLGVSGRSPGLEVGRLGAQVGGWGGRPRSRKPRCSGEWGGGSRQGASGKGVRVGGDLEARHLGNRAE